MAELTFHAFPGATGQRVKHQLMPLPEESLHSVLARAGLPITALPLYVKVDGTEVCTADWWEHELALDAVIDVRPMLQDSGGGGGGSDPVRTLLTIAVLVAAPYLAPTLGFAAGTIGATLITSAAVGVGMAAVNAIAPPMVPEISQKTMPAAAAPSYSARTLGNQARPGRPLLLLTGNHRIVPDLVAPQWSSVAGSDATVNSGKPAVFGVYSSGINAGVLSSRRLGDVPLSNFDVQEINYRNAPPATGSYLQTSDDFGHLPDFDDQRSVLDVGESFTGRSEDGSESEAKSVVRTVPIGTARAEIDLSAQVYFVDQNTGEYRRTQADIEVEYRREGTSQWLAGREIYNSGAPLPLGIWSRGKYDDNSWPPRWESSSLGNVYRESDSYRNEPVEADGTHWRWLPWAMLYDTVGLVHNGPSLRQKQYVIASESATVLRRKLQFHFNPAYAYEIRLTMLGREEQPSGRYQIVWDRLHMIRQDNGRARLQKRFGLCLVGSPETAQVQGQFSTVGFGHIISPLTGEQYFGQNPAHIYAAIAVGARQNGRRLWGGKQTLDTLDLPTLQAWATHCDNMQWASNRVYTDRQSVQETLEQIAADGGGAVAWRGAKLSVVYPDQNDPVVDRISMADMVQGGFNIAYIQQKLPATCIVKYFDQFEADYKQSTAQINIPGGDEALDPIEIEILGITRRSRVLERARLAIARMFYDRRRTKVTLDIAGFVYDRGDVLELSHALCGWGYSGRLVVQNNLNIVLLPQAISIFGSGWVLYLRAPDGTMTSHPLNGVREADNFLLSTPMPADVLTRAEDYTYIIDTAGRAGRKARIIDIVPQGIKQLEITLADEVDAYYNQRLALTLPEPDDHVSANVPAEDNAGLPLYTHDLAALNWPGTTTNCVPLQGVLTLVSGVPSGEYISDVLLTGTSELHIPTLKSIRASHFYTVQLRTGSSEANLLSHSFQPFSTTALLASHIQIKIDIKRYANA